MWQKTEASTKETFRCREPKEKLFAILQYIIVFTSYKTVTNLFWYSQGAWDTSGSRDHTEQKRNQDSWLSLRKYSNSYFALLVRRKRTPTFGIGSKKGWQHSIKLWAAALQRKSHLCIPRKGIARRSLNFHIHVSVSAPRIGPHIFLQQNRQNNRGNV